MCRRHPATPGPSPPGTRVRSVRAHRTARRRSDEPGWRLSRDVGSTSPLASAPPRVRRKILISEPVVSALGPSRYPISERALGPPQGRQGADGGQDGRLEHAPADPSSIRSAESSRALSPRATCDGLTRLGTIGQDVEQRRPFVLHVRARRGGQRIEQSGCRIVAPSRSRRTRQVPLTVPSTRTCPRPMGRSPKSAATRSSAPKRDRSAWPRSTLSYSGRKRTGAGVSESGRGASGRSKKLAAALVAECHEARSEAIHDLAQPADPGPGADVRHARRPERRQVADQQGVDVGRRLHGPSEPGLDRREGRRRHCAATGHEA